MLFSPLITTTPSISPFPKTHHSTTSLPSSIKHQGRIHSTSKFGNFHNLKPKYKPEALDFDLTWYHPSDHTRFNVIIIGADPAGINLAEQVSLYGIKVPTFMYAISLPVAIYFQSDFSQGSEKENGCK
ncbi:capsanthin/capsorubin synthase chromoplast-like, partial [Trifolium medium]|nr:capsanthin/capsorubin synthase chromoplast-like [Trifolium medium]